MKYFVTVFVTAIIVFLSATIYYKGFPVFPDYNKSGIATQSGIPVSSTEVASPISTSTSIQTTTVKAGGVLVFKAYSINVPTTWQYAKEGTPSGDIPIDRLTLTKDGYKITLYQAATGGAPCLYPGDADVEGPSSRFVSFVAITTQTGDLLRRGVPEGGGGFTVCEKQGSNSYGQPTSFGHISITTPANPSASIIVEIDSMLASLKKI